MKQVATLCLTLLLIFTKRSAENGYRLWLRYNPMPAATAKNYQPFLHHISIPDSSATQKIILQEWKLAFAGWCMKEPAINNAKPNSASVSYSRPSNSNNSLHNKEAYSISSNNSTNQIFIESGSDIGWLYATFVLLQKIQSGLPIHNLKIESSPKIQLRLLNHWDNLD